VSSKDKENEMKGPFKEGIYQLDNFQVTVFRLEGLKRRWFYASWDGARPNSTAFFLTKELWAEMKLIKTKEN